MNKPDTKKYALISVFDKTGVEELAKALVKHGYTIISTGGTAKVLKKADIPLTPITEITGNPEAFDGRMKTISFQVESGILYDRKKIGHRKQAKELNIPKIDIVVCNLYPFEQTVGQKNVKEKDAIESIDVGGPTMIRAAAKNFQSVLVVVDPADYSRVIESLNTSFWQAKGATRIRKSNTDSRQARATGLRLRKELAAKGFQHLSYYDGQIGAYLSEEIFPKEQTIVGKKIISLRYGENPHQKAAFYAFPNTHSPLAHLEKRWGREMSATNLTDVYAGLEVVQMFSNPSAVVIKHNTPCGIALGKDSAEALSRAISADPESAFGGVIVMNKPMTHKAALVIGEFKDEKKSNIDIVAVPSIDPKALAYLQKVRKSMGIYTFGNMFRHAEFISASPKILKQVQNDNNTMHIRFLSGGFILQTPDIVSESLKNWKAATKVKPTKLELKQMQLGWQFASRIRSNTIVVMDPKFPMTRGIGSGQTSRIRSAKIALEQAGKFAKGAILVSDSFFPFPDVVELAAKYKIGAIVQQGGSVNDQLSIDVANNAKIPMVFTNRRAFWH